MDYKEQFADLVRRFDETEKRLSALNRAVNGDLPPDNGTRTLRDRVKTVERAVEASNIADAAPMAISQGTGTGDAGMPIMDIEWGKIKTNPTTTPVKTIVLRPCSQNGTEYGNAPDVRVFIRSDRRAQYIGDRKWTTASEVTLAFIRLPVDTTSWDEGDAVGILVGESEDAGLVKVTYDDEIPGLLRFSGSTPDAPQTVHKIIGDSEADVLSATSGENIDVDVINGGNEEQLKISHIGPGAVDDESGAAGGWTFKVLGAGRDTEDLYFSCDKNRHLIDVWSS